MVNTFNSVYSSGFRSSFLGICEPIGMKKLLFLGICVWCSSTALGQYSLSDTVKVMEVEVTASRRKHLSEGYKTVSIAGQQKKQYNQRSIAEFLQYSSNLNVQAYGSPGALASLSLRGTGSSHTQVNWNGFPVNSVTLGSADISFLPVMENHEVDIVYGASGALYGSGTFGGAINIDSRPDYSKHGFHNSLSLTLGSMNTQKAVYSFQGGNDSLQISGSIWGDKSDGDYKYYDNIQGKELNRANADYTQFGVNPDFSFKLPNRMELSGGLWYQVKDLNLPAIMGSSSKDLENQKDSLFRSYLQLKKSFYKSSLQVKGAWFNSDQHYTKYSPDSETFIFNSRIKSNAFYSDANYRYFFSNSLSGDFGVTYSYTTADVVAYHGEQSEYDLGLIAALKYYSNQLRTNVTIRKDWSDSYRSEVLSDIGVSYHSMEDQLIFRAAFSQKFKKPSFNDRFWVPGGNIDLKPETGYSIETGINYALDLKKWGELDVDVSAYYSPIEDMIVWRPAGSDWEATNYQSVMTQGIDMTANYRIQFNKFAWTTGTSVSYNKAIIEELDGQSVDNQPLFYAPTWLSSAYSELSTAKWGVYAGWRFASKRYYDKNETMDPYWLINANLYYQFQFHNQLLRLSGSVDNILDESYQMVRSYPMPGRTWQLRIKYSF